MTRIVTEPISRLALLAACSWPLSACSAYDGGLLESAQSQTRGAVGSSANAVDMGLVDAVGPITIAGGAACERDEDCESAHCNAGLCCTGPDCCADASNCPSGYSSPPVCDEPQRCQGTRTVATCINFSCGSERVPDDSACNASVAAADCGSSPDQFCSGSEDQAPPECLSSICSDDSQCDALAHCQSGTGCSQDRRDGEACSRDAECESDHCNGGLCCAEGDCCTDDDDCENRYVCTDPRACRGHVYRRHCNAARCEEARAPEESSYGCVGQLARTCNVPGYRDVTCYLLPTPHLRECAVCESDADCTWDYECGDGECRLRGEANPNGNN